MTGSVGDSIARPRRANARHARRAREDQRRRVEQMEGLAATLEHVGAAVNVDGALEALLRGAVTLLSAEQGRAGLFDLTTGDCTLEMTLSRDGHLAAASAVAHLAPGSYGARLLAGGPPIVVDDYAGVDSLHVPLDDAARKVRPDGMHSAVHVAIDSRGARIGTLSLSHSRPAFFGPQELAVTQGLASNAGAVIARAQQDETLHNAQIERARLDAALLVARTVAHEINNALSPVVGFAELLALRPSVQADPTAGLYVEHISTAATQVVQQVRQLQQIIRLEEVTGPLGTQLPILDLDRSTATDSPTR